MWKVAATGGTPVKIAQNAVKKGWEFLSYTSQGGSPDSNHLCLRYRYEGNAGVVSDLMRLPLAGGTLTNLTGDIASGANCYRWVSNTPAP